jgi:hypothetical protein
MQQFYLEEQKSADVDIKDNLKQHFKSVIDSLNYVEMIIIEIENKLNSLLVDINENNYDS